MRFSLIFRGIFLVFCYAASCSPSNLQELRCEGEGEVKKLVAELKKIETREDFEKSAKKLRKHFHRIADLLIKARGFPEGGELPPEMALSDELFIELARIYEIAGGRAMVEKSQEEAVRRLSR